MSSFVWFMSLLCLFVSAQHIDKRSRSKRFLIFPRQAPTRHQFIAGIGIPADLTLESLTIGHVLKAEFFLPYNATVYRQNPYLPEYKTKPTYLHGGIEIRKIQEQPTPLRWNIYAYIEHMLNGYGYNGHECMLQTICEANTIQFSKHFSVVHELLHLVLSPSSSLNEDAAEAYDFLLAEQTGIAKGNCEIYNCNIKLLDWISKVMQLNY